MTTTENWELIRADLKQISLKLQREGYPIIYSEDADTINIWINPQPKKVKKKRKKK